MSKGQTICRLCIIKLDPDDPDVRCILNATVKKVLSCVLPFEIPFRPDLPMYICKQCSWNTMDFHSYIEKVQQNQETLDSNFYSDQKSAQNCYEKQNGKKTEKENIDVNINAKELSRNCSEEHFDDMPMVNCKKEIDEILVTNEIHPDLMDFSYEILAGMNESITCGNYEITSSIPDEPTECANCLQLTTVCNNLDDTTVVKNETPVCDSTVDKKEANNDRVVQDKKKKCFKNSKSSKTTKKRTLKTSAEFGCNKCDKKCHTLHQLRNHQRNHYFQTCTICKKTLKSRSMSRHLASHRKSEILSDKQI